MTPWKLMVEAVAEDKDKLIDLLQCPTAFYIDVNTFIRSGSYLSRSLPLHFASKALNIVTIDLLLRHGACADLKERFSIANHARKISLYFYCQTISYVTPIDRIVNELNLKRYFLLQITHTKSK